MPSWVSKEHTHCRVCRSPLPAPYLDLGEQPLANALVHPEDSFCAPLEKHFGPIHGVSFQEQRFPLQVILCEQCGLSQLSVVVNPEILYAGYRFRSGQSEAWVKHCEELAGSIGGRAGEALDIAANDGTMMSALADYGWCVDGVDPAPASYGVIKGTWPECSPRLPSKSYDLVIAQNVLGHVDDPISFLKAIKTVLAPEGRVVVEVPSAEQMIKTCAFDTIYHEHLSYWGARPMVRAGILAGLKFVDMESLPIHGGSLRFWFAHSDETREVLNIREIAPDAHVAFAQRVIENALTAAAIVTEAYFQKQHVLGWGASAKASVILNKVVRHTANKALPSAVIDDCVEKQGMLMPGVHIPIIACPESLADVDVLWLLSWNNAPALKEKAKARGFKGKFLLTNGTPRLEDA